jgi:hypothetical protein
MTLLEPAWWAPVIPDVQNNEIWAFQQSFPQLLGGCHSSAYGVMHIGENGGVDGI